MLIAFRGKKGDAASNARFFLLNLIFAYLKFQFMASICLHLQPLIASRSQYDNNLRTSSLWRWIHCIPNALQTLQRNTEVCISSRAFLFGWDQNGSEKTSVSQIRKVEVLNIHQRDFFSLSLSLSLEIGRQYMHCYCLARTWLKTMSPCTWYVLLVSWFELITNDSKISWCSNQCERTCH